VNPVIPTTRPTLEATPTTTAQALRVLDETPTATSTAINAFPTGGPSPTPLFGPTRTLSADQLTPTRVSNPNAPRIEFFRADAVAIAPGGSVTLFWSTRNTNRAVIYHLNAQGERTLVENVPPDGRQTVTTSARARGQISFVLAVGDGAQRVEQTLLIPLQCPIVWFFLPAPQECPNEEARPTLITEQIFQRGRMFYIASSNRIYVLFNDGQSPAWVDYENRYNPAVHPERDENYERALTGTGLVQAVGRMGYVWRSNDTVRTRLGDGTQPETTYDGLLQTAPVSGSTGSSLYITSTAGTVIQLLPNGRLWQIITPS
jgi:hypothetical protein